MCNMVNKGGWGWREGGVTQRRWKTRPSYCEQRSAHSDTMYINTSHKTWITTDVGVCFTDPPLNLSSVWQQLVRTVCGHQKINFKSDTIDVCAYRYEYTNTILTKNLAHICFILWYNPLLIWVEGWENLSEFWKINKKDSNWGFDYNSLTIIYLGHFIDV